MTIKLLGDDGKTYDAADQKQADDAIATGLFKPLQSVDPIKEDVVSAPPPVDFKTQQPPIPDQSKEMLDRLQATAPPTAADLLAGDPDNNGIGSPKDVKEVYSSIFGLDTTQPPQPPQQTATPDLQLDLPLVGDDGKFYDSPTPEKTKAALATGLFRYSSQQDRDEKAKEDQYIATHPNRATEDFESPLHPLNLLRPEFIAESNDTEGFFRPGGLFLGLASTPEDEEERRVARRVAEREHPDRLKNTETFAHLNEMGVKAAALGGAATAAEEALGVTSIFGKLAVQTGVFAAPEVAHAIVEKDPVAAAEALALNAGITVLTHGLFSGASKLFSAAEEGITSKIATRELMEAANITAKDTLEEASAKLAKYREESPVIKTALEKLDNTIETKPIIEEHINKSAVEIEQLKTDTMIAREAAEKQLAEAAENLKKIKNPAETPSALAVFNAAKEALADLPKLSKADNLFKKTIEAVGEKLKSVDSFSTAKELQEELSNSGNAASKAAANILDSNIKNAEVASFNSIKDPAVVKGLEEKNTIDKVRSYLEKTKSIVEEQKGIKGFLPDSRDWDRAATAVLFGHPAAGATSLLRNTGKKALKTVGTVGKTIFDNALGTSVGQTIIEKSQNIGLAASRNAKDLFTLLKNNRSSKAFITDNAVKLFLPDNGKGKSERQQLETLSAAINNNLANPQEFADTISPVVQKLQSEGLHKTAEAYTQHTLRQMKVIQLYLPKNDLIQKANPFSPKVLQTEDIDPAVRDRYNRVLKIAIEPDHLLELIKTNQITKGDVAIAAATNPIALQRMRDALTEAAIKHPPDLTYQQRLSVGILMGQELDAATEPLEVLQGAYAPYPPSGSTGATGGKGGKTKMSAKSSDNLQNANLTVSQQAAGHGK